MNKRIFSNGKAYRKKVLRKNIAAEVVFYCAVVGFHANLLTLSAETIKLVNFAREKWKIFSNVAELQVMWLTNCAKRRISFLNQYLIFLRKVLQCVLTMFDDNLSLSFFKRFMKLLLAYIKCSPTSIMAIMPSFTKCI